MACNCKVTQQIDYLHKKYGNKIPTSKKTEISFHIREQVREFFVFLVTIVFLPFMFLSVLYKALFTKDKKISIKKLMRFANVRN